MKIRAEVTEILTMKSGLYIPDEWIYREVLDLTDDEISTLKGEKPKDFKPLAMARGPRGGSVRPLAPEQWNALLQSDQFGESLHNLRWLLDRERGRTKHSEYAIE